MRVSALILSFIAAVAFSAHLGVAWAVPVAGVVLWSTVATFALASLSVGLLAQAWSEAEGSTGQWALVLAPVAFGSGTLIGSVAIGIFLLQVAKIWP